MPVVRQLFLLLASLLVTQQASAYCFQQWACVEVEKKADSVNFWLSNKTPYPYTATLDVDSRNLIDSNTKRPPDKVTIVVEGNQRIRAMSLKKRDSRARYWVSEDFHWAPGDMHAQHKHGPYLLPYARGERHRIVQGFGGRWSHTGASRYAVDFAMPVGTAVHAARGGVVIDVKEDSNRGGANRRYARYANFIVILHDDRTTGEYYHLQQNGAIVSVGDTVTAGQKIGYSGNTGFSSLPHLHFAVYRAKPFGDYESLPFRFEKRRSD